MYEYINFDGANFEIIEIISSHSELESLKRSGNKNLKVFLPFCLSIGNLAGMSNLERNDLEKYINSKDRTLFKNGLNFKYEYDLLLKYASRVSKIRIWLSHLDCDDYCLLLYLCYILPEKNISVIFSEKLNWDTTTLGCVSEQEVKK